MSSHIHHDPLHTSQVSLEEGQLAAERLEKEVITVDHWQEKARRYQISDANTFNLQTWFQIKLLHVYSNTSDKDRYV